MVKVWSTSAGNLLGQFNTNQMVNKMYEYTLYPSSPAFSILLLSLCLFISSSFLVFLIILNINDSLRVRISPDSRYITVAAFTSDVKVCMPYLLCFPLLFPLLPPSLLYHLIDIVEQIWEVSFKKSGEFDSITKVMDLRGHNTGVNCVCFSADSTRVYTGIHPSLAISPPHSSPSPFPLPPLSPPLLPPSPSLSLPPLTSPSGAKDGVWRAYRINVRYAMNEDPVKEKQVDTGSPINKMELAPNGKTLAIIGMSKSGRV